MEGFAEISGGKLYYESSANTQNPCIVLMHAGFLDLRMWDLQFDFFANEGFRVIRYDRRGLGKSDKPSSSYDEARDLFELLNFLRIQKCSPIGISNGGGVAIDFALDYPDKVSSLILVAPTVEGYEYADMHEEKLDKAMDDEWTRWAEALKDNRFKEAIEIHLGILAPALSEDAKAKIVKIALDNYAIFNTSIDEMRIKRNPAAFKRLSEIKVPTLLVWGDKDYPGQISLAERVQSFIPGSRKILIHGADHLVNVSQPATFNRVVSNFLKSQKSK